MMCLTACNDAPSIIGSEVIEPSDSSFAATLRVVTSDSLQMFSGDSTLTQRILLPLRSSLAGPILIGSAGETEARVLLSFSTDEFAPKATDSIFWGTKRISIDTAINGKDTTIIRDSVINKSLADAIRQDSLFFSFSQLRISGEPKVYRFGDTLDQAISFGIFELYKNFSSFASWDSVYDQAGNSTLYWQYGVPIAQYVNSTFFPALDETIGDPNAVPPTTYTYNESGTLLAHIGIDKNYVKKLFRLGLDSAGRTQIYGLALHPTGMRSITRFNGTITLQVNFRKLGSDNPPIIRRFTLTAFNMVQTPPAAAGEAVLQGGRKHTARVMINLDSLPPTARIFDGQLEFPIDKEKSLFGTDVQDQGVVAYSPLENADTAVFAARISNDRSKIIVSNRGQRERQVAGSTQSVGFITMGEFLQEYVHKAGLKHPIYIVSQTNTRLDRIVLRKSSETPGTRPYLKVYYSLQDAKP